MVIELNDLIEFLKARAITDNSTNSLKFLTGEFNLEQYLNSQILIKEENIRYWENCIKEAQIELEAETKREKPDDYQLKLNKVTIRRYEKEIMQLKVMTQQLRNFKNSKENNQS